jgi:hypothetical protein
LPGDRQVVKGNVAEVDVGVGLARIIGDDRHGIHRELAAAPAIEEIDQAVVETRNHQRDALQLVGRSHRPCHREVGGDRLELIAQALDLSMRRGGVEYDPHEEVTGLDIIELLGVENVEPAVEQRGCDFGDDPGPVDARQGENVAGVGHGKGFLSAGQRRGTRSVLVGRSAQGSKRRDGLQR